MGLPAPEGPRFLLPCWLWPRLEVPYTARPRMVCPPYLSRASRQEQAPPPWPEGSFSGLVCP